MEGRLYLLRRTCFGHASFLRLEGPFEYPEWVPHPARATPMRYAKAHQCATSHAPKQGGDAAVVDRDLVAEEWERQGRT